MPVWLRVMHDSQESPFFYVTAPDIRDATRERASWVVPRLVVDAYLGRVPLEWGSTGRR